MKKFGCRWQTGLDRREGLEKLAVMEGQGRPGRAGQGRAGGSGDMHIPTKQCS